MSPKSSPPDNEAGYLLSAVLIGVLAVLFVAVLAAEPRMGPVEPGAAAVLTGLYLFAWGAMFALSYWWSHKSFFLRGLMWLCVHGSRPGGRKMALFYAALAGFLGLMGIFLGLGWAT